MSDAQALVAALRGAAPAQQPQPSADVGQLVRALDQTANYNTPLNPAQESQFQQWIQQSGRGQDLADYDLRGAWLKNTKAAANGHLPDDWKKPNHPTFSQQSIYSGPYATGGEWQPQPGGAWQFSATPDNLRYRDAAALQAYFQQVEHGNRLVLPAEPSAHR